MRATALVLATLFATLFMWAVPAHADTVDDIVAKAIQAQGGADKLKAIKSLRLTGKIQLGGGDGKLEAEWSTLQKRPGMMRNEFYLQGMTQIDAFDGTTSWSVQPFDGRRDAIKGSADDVRVAAQNADMDGPLVDWKAKGHKVEYLGTEDVDGTDAIKLRATLKGGDVEYIYLDPDTYLEIRETDKIKIRGSEQVSETDYGSYQLVEGVWMPFSIDSGQPGGPKTSHTQILRAEANIDAPDSAFKMPSGNAMVRMITAGTGGVEGGAMTATPPAPAGNVTVDAGVISGLGARNIGSAAMSGRVSAIAARNEGGKTTIYVGAASGGVWRSFDGGTIFTPVFDKQPVQSIGAITIDPSHPKTVWVGTGESWTRNSVSIGDGIYKSTDAGETWKNMGLPESERITRILVHPTNGDVVYACVPGKLWSDSADRGVYKTTDGGRTWSQILKGPNLSTGCSSLAMDPKAPDTLYAGLWDFRRKGWTFRSGGDGPDAFSGSSLVRSTDGGKTWSDLPKSEKTLPAKPWGRVEVAIAPSNPKVVYAFIESTKSALYVSGDGGQTWEGRDRSQGMIWRPFYFARLVVDPTRPERLFKGGGGLIVSEDGGKSFSYAGGGGHGDWHDIWIDPDNPKHVLAGDDGGFWISWDGGVRWWKTGNLPISQFYHVSVDDKDPYRVYGGLQDNGSWMAPSAAAGGITNSQWKAIYGSDGFYALVDPSDPNHAYAEGQGGYIGRLDLVTQATRDIQPKARYKEKLRFNWNTPIFASATKKGTIYMGSQFLFRSKDHGDTWDRISPDLTTNDPEKQKQEQSGGVTVDNSSAEMHTTIYTISESPKNGDVVWAGTDDGNLQLTKNGGKSWTNVIANVKGLPEHSWVSWVEASRFDAATAYATFDRHTFGDMTPWVYKTTDYGATWTRIVDPSKGVRGYAHTVKEDTVAKNLLFVGTEMGLWISIDGGDHWAAFKGGLFPAVAVREVQVQPRDNDLVIATHGRGIWIVDDITPLRSLSADNMQKTAVFLPGRPVQQRMGGQGGWVEGDAAFVGDNPPGGAVITYYQRTRHLYGPIKLEVFDAKGKLIDTLSASKRRGINRVSWSMQMPPPRVPRAAQAAFSSSSGPRVLPGTYTVRLTKGKDVVEEKLAVGLDRRAPYKPADRKVQYDAVVKAEALFNDMSALVDKIDGASQAAADRAAKLPKGDPTAAKLAEVTAKLADVKKAIVATKEGGAITGEERIREHLDILYGALQTYEGKPGKYQLERIDALRKELDDVQKAFDGVATAQIAPLDKELEARNLEPIPTDGREVEDEARPLSEGEIRCVETHGRECEVDGVAAERD